MKNRTQTILRIALGTAAAVLLSNCASTRNTLENRIAGNQSVFEGLPDRDKSLISEGKIAEGMSKDGVYFSWGAPSRRAEGASGGTTKETWVYHKNRPVIDHSVSVGYGYGGYGGFGRGRSFGRYGYGGYDCYPGSYFYGGPTISYVPYTSAKVHFTNSKVSAWEQVR